MKSKRVKIEYFLLLVIAFLFQNFVKDESIFSSKKYFDGLKYEKINDKDLYAFIRDFQQKASTLSIKKSIDLLRGKNEFFSSLENPEVFTLLTLSSLTNIKTGIKPLNIAENLQKMKGIGEKMYKSSYLV